MAKYLFQAQYSADGLKGLIKETGSGRKKAVSKAISAAGGKVESFYFSFGCSDAVLVVDLPDNISAAALAVSVSSTGAVRINTTPLLTAEEMDKAIEKGFGYRPPGA